MRWHAVIPTIGRSRYLPALLDSLYAEGCDHVELPVNGDSVALGVAHQVARSASAPVDWAMPHVPDRSIYESWNRAMDYAAADGALLAVLNDDIELIPGALDACLFALARNHSVAIVGLDYGRSSDAGVDLGAPLRRVFGTYREAGLGGFAFVVDPTKCARVDGRFQWWYGDDDLVRRTTRDGWAVVLHTGAPVSHPEPSLSGNQMPWLAEACAADAALFAELWP